MIKTRCIKYHSPLPMRFVFNKFNFGGFNGKEHLETFSRTYRKSETTKKKNFRAANLKVPDKFQSSGSSVQSKDLVHMKLEVKLKSNEVKS